MNPTCPVCKRDLPQGASPFGAFCSERCKTIDLGAWLSGTYRISRGVEEEDLDAGVALPTESGEQSDVN